MGNIGCSLEKWKQVIFSDDSNFEVMNRKSKVCVERFKSEKYSHRFVLPRLQGGGESIGVWGCFNFNEVGVCNIELVGLCNTKSTNTARERR